MRISRRRFLAGLGTAASAAVGIEGLFLQPRRLDVTTHVIGVPPAREPGLPRSGIIGTPPAPIRLVQLTDLHLKGVGAFEESFADRVSTLQPDVILITGDAIDRSDGLPDLSVMLGLLPPVPRLAILGNWERWSGLDVGQVRAAYERGETHLLVNESVNLTHEGQTATFVGVDDFVGGRPDIEQALLSSAATPNRILLSHCPAFRDELDSSTLPEFEAVLAGHTHGGQIAIGGWAPVTPPGSGRYVSGWYQDGGPALYVSRGLGTSVFPLRLGSVPEITVFDWWLT